MSVPRVTIFLWSFDMGGEPLLGVYIFIEF
jgi:hypothetical protein